MLQSFVLACYRYFFVYRSYWIIYFINLRGTLGMIYSSLKCSCFIILGTNLGQNRILSHRKKLNRTSDLWFPRSDALPLNHRDCTVKQGMQAWVTCVLHTARNINVESVMCVNFRKMIYFELDKVLLGTQVVFFVPCSPIYIFETKNHISLNQIAYLTLLIFWHARATSLIFFSKQAHPPPTVYEVKRSISSLTRLICLSELFPTLKIQSWIWNEKNSM